MIIFNALQTTLSAGIGRSSYGVAKGVYELRKIPFKIVIREEDKELFSFADSDDLIIAKGITNSKKRNFYEQFVLPREVYKKYPNAIIHYPDTIAPIFAKNKVIITVNDLSFKTMRSSFTWKTAMRKNILTDISVRKASKILTISNFAKEEVLKYYKNIDKSKIKAIHIGFDDFSKDIINEKEISQEILNIKKPFILTVSTISPRKNVDGLIKAFNVIKNEITCNLVIAGRDGWMYEEVHKLAEELHLEDRVIFTGGINDEELKFLYKNSKLFIYPSFYEGFGLPPLEAMSFGIPCIVSNKTSIPEVVGEAAILVDPNDIDEMAKAMKNVISDNDLYNKLVKKGFERVKVFSWNKCAENTLKIYNEYSI